MARIRIQITAEVEVNPFAFGTYDAKRLPDAMADYLYRGYVENSDIAGMIQYGDMNFEFSLVKEDSNGY